MTGSLFLLQSIHFQHGDTGLVVISKALHMKREWMLHLLRVAAGSRVGVALELSLAQELPI